MQCIAALYCHPSQLETPRNICDAAKYWLRALQKLVPLRRTIRPHEAGFSPARAAVRQRTETASAGARHGEHDGEGEDTIVDDDRVRDREDNDDANGEDDGEDYEIEERDDAGEEDEDDEGEDLGDDSKDDADADKAMHAKKGLPCVPVGQNFAIRGQYGSITCVRIGTIGIPRHRFRAGF